MERTRFFAVVVILLALTVGPAHAAGIVVNTLADGSVAGACTLRDAITAANSNTAVNGCMAGSGPDTITFSVSGTITLGSILPAIADGSTLTIDGTGQAITVSGNNAVGVMDVAAGGTLDVTNMVVANGSKPCPTLLCLVGGSELSGGGLSNHGTVSIASSTFANNRATVGAGIYNGADGRLSVRNSTLSGNIGINQLPAGGGIANYGALTVSNSTFVGNAARLGGGILNAGNLTVSNSTFSGNTASSSGGGMYLSTGTVTNTTVFGNTASEFGGGIFAGPITLANTIVANNAGGDCANFGGLISASGVNLIADGSCSQAGALTGDPMLGPLADNGGPTMTHALTAASALAVDKGDNGVCAAYATDQRGSPRKVDGDADGSAVCDLGAYEYSRLFDFAGFFAPVDNLPVVNTIKAGRAVPLTFSLGGYQGLSIFAANSPSSQKVACDAGAPLADVEQTVAAAGSSLSYDPVTDTYTYVWKTDKSWAGTCRQLVMQLADGTFHLASFRLK